MAPGRRRGYKGAKTKSELSLGDLVLAKVKGFPAWPAKISRPEDWKHVPDPKKYFVQFFGTAEIAFVAPVDIQAFTSESKNKLSARCQGKTVKYFAQAVKEICEEFEELQCKNLGDVGDYNDAENLASETNSVDSVIGEASEVSVKNRRDSEEPNSKLETKETGDLDSALERCSETIGEMDRQNVKPCSSDDMNRNLSPQLSSRKRIKPSTKSANPMKETNGDQGVSINGRQPKLAMEPKRKHDDAKRRNSDAVISREHNQDGVQIKHASGGNMKVSSADNSRSDSRIGSERKGKKLLKGKKHSAAADDGRVDTEVFCDDDNEVRKKMKFQHDQEKQAFRKNEASLPLKMDDIEGNRLVSGGKAASRAQPNANESKHSSDEDDLPPTKRQRRALGEKSNSTSISESRSGNSTLQKNGLVQPNKVQSPIMQLPGKRRAVRICDEDEDDELPKTPIHVGSTLKASVTPRVSDSKKKIVKRGETHENGHMVSRNTGRLEDEFKDQAQSSQISNKALSPTAQQRMEKNTPEILAKYVSSDPTQLVTEKIPLMEAKPVAVSPERSPRSATAARPLADPRKKQLSKTPGSLYQKKIPPGTNSSLGTASNRLNSSLSQSATERSKPTLSGEKKKTTPSSNYQLNDSVVSVGNTVESITSHGERLDGGKATKTNLPVDLAIPDSALSMKNLIAAAQARKRQANFHNPFANPLHLLIPDADMTGHSPSPTSAALAVESRNIPQIDVQGHPSSSSVDVLPSINGHENDDLEERRANSGHQATVSSLSGGTEAAVARDAFEGMIETLSRTKESIGRATRLAIDCAKYGIANEVVELLIRKLENEISFHRKVDLFFLVDSITQCSHSQKGIAGASYIPIVQAELPRLIGAAAPPGAGAQENRRQCQKVLRLWLERKILPESVLRRYVDDIGAVNDGVSAGLSQRRPSRAERAIDDPIREMEGMFVDEYGSNTTFQLPGLLSSHLFEEDDEDEDSFPSKLYKVVLDTSPSENIIASKDPENCTVTPNDRRHCILEEVDGELEMEDVSGHDKDDRTLIANGKSVFAVSEPHSDVKFQSPSNISELLPSPEGSPPLPPGSPPTTPPLPNSPPPVSPPPPPPPPLPSSSAPPPPPPPPPSPPFSQQLIPPPPIGPPPYLHSLPPQPVLMSQHVPPVPSTSKPLAYHPPPLHHDIGGTPSGNPPVHMLSSTQGSHTDAPRRELYSQQSSFFPAVAGSNAREQVGYNLSRPIEYSQTDAGISHQPSQQRQQMLPGTATFSQRPLHPDAPPQQVPGRFSYPNPAMQHQYPPYSLPVFSDGPRRYSSDEQWRMPVNDFNADIPSGGWNTGGYFVPPSERAPASAIFRPSPANSLPPAAPISVRGVPMMPCRPDMSAVNWRPA